MRNFSTTSMIADQVKKSVVYKIVWFSYAMLSMNLKPPIRPYNHDWLIALFLLRSSSLRRNSSRRNCYKLRAIFVNLKMKIGNQVIEFRKQQLDLLRMIMKNSKRRQWKQRKRIMCQLYKSIDCNMKISKKETKMHSYNKNYQI